MNLRQFIKDAGSNYIIYGLQLLLGIITIPIYLKVYGETLYGVYLLSFGLASTLTFLQFGSGESILRFVAEFLSDKDEKKYGLALRTSGIITVFSSVLVFAVFFITAKFQNYIFNIPAEYDTISSLLFIGSGFYGVVFFISRLPNSMLRGASIFYKRNRLVVLELFFRGVITACVYFFRIPIYSVLVGEILLLLIAMLFDLFILRQNANQVLRFDLLKRDNSVVFYEGEPWLYAKQTFWLALVSFFSQSVDRLIIGLFLDVKLVAVYSIVTKPFNVIKSLLQKVFVIFDPQYIKVLKEQGKQDLLNFLIKSTMTIVIVVIFLVAALIVVLPDLYKIWLRTDKYLEYIIYSNMLLAVLCIRSFSSLFYRALYIIGLTKELIKLNIILVSINLIVGLVVTCFYGFIGVILGTCLQLFLAVFFILNLGKKYFTGNAATLSHLNKLIIYSVLAALILAFWIGLCNFLRNWLSPLMYYSGMYSIILFVAVGLICFNRLAIGMLMTKFASRE